MSTCLSFNKESLFICTIQEVHEEEVSLYSREARISHRLFEMIRADDDDEVETKSSTTSNHSEMSRMRAASSSSADSSLQGYSESKVQIEMGTFSSRSDDVGGDDGVTDSSLSSLGEAPPFKL